MLKEVLADLGNTHPDGVDIYLEVLIPEAKGRLGGSLVRLSV